MIPPGFQKDTTPRICESCGQWQPNLTPECQKFHHRTNAFDTCDAWEQVGEDYECL